jgi:urate oxidase
VSSADIRIEETLWNRIDINGKPHDHAFIGGNNEKRTCRAKITRDEKHPDGVTILRGGISGMMVLKTTKSGFVGYIKDKYTTLKETTDRIFATAVDATWNFTNVSADFNRAYDSIRGAMVRVFAEHDSLAVQQTLYAMGEAALAACDVIDEISLTMPNQHRLLVNLQPFGMENQNEIFVATSEPYGLIAGTIRRS